MSRDDPRTEAIHETMVALFGYGDNAQQQVQRRILGSLYDKAYSEGVDTATAREARASIKAGEPVISWEEVKAECGLPSMKGVSHE